MFFQADMPLLDKATVLAITSAFDGTRITAPEIHGELRSPVVFPAFLRGELEALREDEGGRTLFKKHPGFLVSVPFQDAGIFRDIDTINDYNELHL
jgi:molybdenum cofactor cytidylyltransferase